MSDIVECPLASASPIKSQLHIINGLSPPIDLTGSERGSQQVLGHLLRPDTKTPETIIFGLLAVASVDLIIFDLVEDILVLLGVFSIGLFLLVTLEEVHVIVLVLQLVPHCFELAKGLSSHVDCLLIEHLAPSGDLG